MNLIDYLKNNIRITEERLTHIREHPEMIMHIEKIAEALISPDTVVKSRSDVRVRLYFRLL